MTKFKDVVFREGKIITSFGYPSAGMTNVAVVLMERFVDEGYTIYSNGEFWGDTSDQI